uniref:Curculin-like (Mannose-binding) lectin n=1 Tax=Medicago truncatula TaxID=3880 RepID=Q2HTU6_MEDTR|nr:Curculin-like (mannose-binding) lectin [Medicago truncatula]
MVLSMTHRHIRGARKRSECSDHRPRPCVWTKRALGPTLCYEGRLGIKPTLATAIPALKISKNVRTGEEVRISSWKSVSDPSYGSFSLGLETGYVTELFIWNGTLTPFWRSGPWNGHVFIGTPNIISLFRDGVSLEEKCNQLCYSNN